MNVMVSVPMPLIESVSALSDHKIRVVWRKSLRPHGTEIVNLAPLIEALKFYKPLRTDRKLFRSVHVIEDGNAIAWADEDIDMAATSIERLAEESMTASDFRNFMASNLLTKNRAAAALGFSPRQIAYYSSGRRPIPRTTVLAVFGYLSRRQQMVGGIRSGSNLVMGQARPTETVMVRRATVRAG